MALPLDDLWLACHRVFSHLQTASVPLARGGWSALQRAVVGYRLAAAALADKAEAQGEAASRTAVHEGTGAAEALFAQAEALRLVHAVLQLLEVGYCTPSPAALAAASGDAAIRSAGAPSEAPPCLTSALMQWLRDNFIPALQEQDVREVFGGEGGMPSHAAFDPAAEGDAWDCVSRLFMEGRVYEAAEVAEKIGVLQRDPDAVAFGRLLAAFPLPGSGGGVTASAWAGWKERASKVLAQGVWTPSRNPTVYALLLICAGRLAEGLRGLLLLGQRAAASLGAAAAASGAPFYTWYYALLCLLAYSHPRGTLPRSSFAALLRQALEVCGQEVSSFSASSSASLPPCTAEVLGTFLAVLSGVPESALRLCLRLGHPWAAAHAGDLLWRGGFLSDPRTQTAFALGGAATQSRATPPSAYDAFLKANSSGSQATTHAPVRPSLLLLHAHTMLATTGGKLWHAAAAYAAAACASGVAACFPREAAAQPGPSAELPSAATATLEVAVRSGSTPAAEDALLDTLTVFGLQAAMGDLGHAGACLAQDESSGEEVEADVTAALARCETEVLRVLAAAEALGLKPAVLEAAAAAWVAAAVGASSRDATEAAPGGSEAPTSSVSPAASSPLLRPPHPAWLGSALAWALTREAAAPETTAASSSSPSPLYAASLALLSFLRQALAQPLHQWKTWAGLGGALVLGSPTPEAAAAVAGLPELPPPPTLAGGAAPEGALPYGLPPASSAVLDSLDASLALAMQGRSGAADVAAPAPPRIVASTVHALLASLSAAEAQPSPDDSCSAAWARPLQHLFLALPPPLPAAASAAAPLRVFLVYQAVLTAAAAAGTPPPGVDAAVARRWGVALAAAALSHSSDALLTVPSNPREEACFPAWAATELVYLLGAGGLLGSPAASQQPQTPLEAGWWTVIRSKLLGWDTTAHAGRVAEASAGALPPRDVLFTLAALASPGCQA